MIPPGSMASGAYAPRGRLVGMTFNGLPVSPSNSALARSDSCLALLPPKLAGRSRGALPMIDGSSRAIGPGDDPRGSATRDGSHPGGLRTTVLSLRLDQGPNPRRRRPPGYRPAHRLCPPPDHGVEPGTPLHQLPPRLEPRRLVLPGRWTNPPGPDSRPDPPRLADRLGCRRHDRTPRWPPHPGQGLLSRCGAVVEEARCQVLRPTVDHPDDPGTGALQPAGLGAASADRLELARGRRPPSRPQDVNRLGAADGPASPPLAARARADPGRRWWFRGGQVGPR